MLYTGVRIGEALGLQWEDVDLEAHRAVVRRQVSPSGKIGAPKSESGERPVDLPGVLVDVLRTARAVAGLRSPWVLGVEPAHNSAGRSRLRKALANACKAAGVAHLTPHGLRHSWISFRGLLGQDARLIQGQAGHATPEMTEHYTHLQRSDLRAVDDAADLIRPRQSRLFKKSGDGSK
jgi:integrase